MQLRTYLTALVAILAAAVLTDPANATTCANGAKDYPKCTKPVDSNSQMPAQPAVNVAANPSASSSSSAGALAGALAGSSASTGPVSSTASAGSVTNKSSIDSNVVVSGAAAAGDSSATGGTSSATSGSSGATLNSTSGDTRALALSFAPPATLPPMSAVQCASPQIRQETPFGAGVLGSFGRGSSSTDTSDCVLIGIYNSMVERCLFSSAKQVQDMLVKKHLPNFQAEGVAYLKDSRDPGFVDYSPTQCAEMRKPPAPPTPVVIALPPPPAPVPPPEPKKVSLSADALFDFDKDTLKPAGKLRLDELATTLRGEAANIIITGHTDSRGTDQYNDRLSMRRANAVRAHLALAGVDLERMVPIGKGKREPHCTENTEACHAANRRVDVQITVAQASARLAALAR